MEKELISIILPIWKPKFNELKQCIESLINQTYSKIEIILVYTSTKDYDEKFYSFLKQYVDERIKVVKNEKLGLANALNEGIKNANGEFIARIDQDDYCDNKRFEMQLKFKKENNANIIGSWAHHIASDGTIISNTQKPTTHNEIRKKMMLHCPMSHPAILMDRKMLNEIGLYDPNFESAEDYELYFRAMNKNFRFGNVPEYLVFTRENPDSMTRGSKWQKQRRLYMKAKTKALKEYNFVKPLDVLYYLITPVSYVVSPRMWRKLKRLTGWHK